MSSRSHLSPSHASSVFLLSLSSLSRYLLALQGRILILLFRFSGGTDNTTADRPSQQHEEKDQGHRLAHRPALIFSVHPPPSSVAEGEEHQVLRTLLRTNINTAQAPPVSLPKTASLSRLEQPASIQLAFIPHSAFILFSYINHITWRSSPTTWLAVTLTNDRQTHRHTDEQLSRPRQTQPQLTAAASCWTRRTGALDWQTGRRS